MTKEEALEVLAPLAGGEEITREDLPYLLVEAEKSRREFSEEELTEAEHAERLAALVVLAKEL